ncbi:MAG TPA: M20/M25/M40 family metallo-hydrolase [Blastocatellia bacterium]|nr:M20/M25/M40 family metallo-hydrolase [Blastocatellia bacterium]
MRNRRIGESLSAAIALAATLAFSASASFKAASARTVPTPDFAAARNELISILSGFVKIDTSNPPGNETRGAEYLKAILDREGIPSDIFEREPGRGNLVARLKGNGKKRPILLMGHIDVVGVERDKWTVDPFGGVVKDGYIYGRGASDDKGMTSVCLETILLLHRLKVPLDRDVIFLAEAGEEGTTRAGIDFMVEQHWDKIECEFALNEGGTIYESDGKVRYVAVSTTEKVPRGFRLIARGTSGHGSVPRLDNAITHLAAAVAKVGSWQTPMRLNETTRAFFSRLATISPPEEAFLFTHLEDPAASLAVQETIRAKYGTYNSVLRTSIVPTIIKGGFRSNVIPAEAEATLDVRAVPDEDIKALAEALRRLIDDPAVEVIAPPARGRPATPPSKLETEMFRAIERAQARVFPGVVTLPTMLTGATDSAQLRAKGVQAYGIGSVASDRERASVHGNDERLSVDGLGRFLELVYWAVTAVSASE